MLQKLPDINFQKMIPTKKVQYDEIIPHLPQMGKSKLFCLCVLAEISSGVSEHIWNCTFFLFWCSLCRHLGICTAEFSAYLTFGLNQLFFLNDDRSRKVDPQLHEKKNQLLLKNTMENIKGSRNAVRHNWTYAYTWI